MKDDSLIGQKLANNYFKRLSKSVLKVSQSLVFVISPRQPRNCMVISNSILSLMIPNVLCVYLEKEKSIVKASSGLLLKMNINILEEKGYEYILGVRIKNETA